MSYIFLTQDQFAKTYVSEAMHWGQAEDLRSRLVFYRELFGEQVRAYEFQAREDVIPYLHTLVKYQLAESHLLFLYRHIYYRPVTILQLGQLNEYIPIELPLPTHDPQPKETLK